MQIRWTKVPFLARNRKEFSRGLTLWLGQVFYERLPAMGYEIREEQIYTAFRLARALADGTTLFAEAGSGTGKTFAYLLPAICYARFRGKPVVVASASGVLQAQLTSPDGDIAALSRLLDLQIDARLASDPGEHICKVKVNHLAAERPMQDWKALHAWATRTRTGARSEVPQTPDQIWSYVAWDPSLPCDTCKHRGACHVMAARKHYRAAADLVVTDHRLFAQDLLTRAERNEAGQLPLLPSYAAAVLDEGHHLPEIWQRAQGCALSFRRLKQTLDLIVGYLKGPGAVGELAAARKESRERLAGVLVTAAQRAGQDLFANLLAAAGPAEGKRHIVRDGAVLWAAQSLVRALELVQDELATEEAMQEGTEFELVLRAYQDRLDEVTGAVGRLQSQEVVAWVEEEELWIVPRHPASLFEPGYLAAGTPLLFSSATLEPAYAARALSLAQHDRSRVGVPFNLGKQVLVYQPATDGDELEQALAVIRAMAGRTLVLLNSMAEVQRYKERLRAPCPLLYEGDADRGNMLDRFREDLSSSLVGATFWEGVDVPGEPLSCVLIPRLPFPAHDPLILERRRQAVARGEDPSAMVDLPEMLLKLKQGAGRLIRTARDRGVLALLDRSYLGTPWAGAVTAIFPPGAEQTADLKRVAAFCTR